MMMQILRIFGSLLFLTYDSIALNHWSLKNDSFTYTIPFILQINQFCAESLKKINMDNAIGFDALDLKPFTNVGIVDIGTCLLENHCLNKLFSRIRKLKVYFEVKT